MEGRSFWGKAVLLHSDARFSCMLLEGGEKNWGRTLCPEKWAPESGCELRASEKHLFISVRASGDRNWLISKGSVLQKMYSPAIFQKHKGRWDYNTINIIALSNQKCDIPQINYETSVATPLSNLSVFIFESWGRWDAQTFWFITLYSFSGHLHTEKTTRNEKAGNEVVSI